MSRYFQNKKKKCAYLAHGLDGADHLVAAVGARELCGNVALVLTHKQLQRLLDEPHLGERAPGAVGGARGDELGRGRAHSDLRLLAREVLRGEARGVRQHIGQRGQRGQLRARSDVARRQQQVLVHRGRDLPLRLGHARLREQVVARVGCRGRRGPAQLLRLE